MSKVDKKPRNTKQLQVVWEAIKDDDSHPTADQVYDKVRESLPNVSLGTVYRNLQKISRRRKAPGGLRQEEGDDVRDEQVLGPAPEIGF